MNTIISAVKNSDRFAQLVSGKMYFVLHPNIYFSQISDLKLHIEELEEKIENREQQIEQLREQRDRGKLTRGSPVEGIEFEHDKEIERQMQALQRENKQLRVT